MAAPRKHPPPQAAETIETLAEQGFSIIGIAKRFVWCVRHLNDGVKSTANCKRHLKTEGNTTTGFDCIDRSAAVANKPPCVNAFFLLECLHGLREFDSAYAKVDVNVAVATNVMVIKHMGSSDAEWQEKALKQQRALAVDIEAPRHVEAPTYVALPEPLHRAVVPSWVPVPSYHPPSELAPSWEASYVEEAPPAPALTRRRVPHALRDTTSPRANITTLS